MMFYVIMDKPALGTQKWLVVEVAMNLSVNLK